MVLSIFYYKEEGVKCVVKISSLKSIPLPEVLRINEVISLIFLDFFRKRLPGFNLNFKE